jgi:hypothetical protein
MRILAKKYTPNANIDPFLSRFFMQRKMMQAPDIRESSSSSSFCGDANILPPP